MVDRNCPRTFGDQLSRPSKNLCVFLDGTWAKKDGKVPSNVVRLYEAAAENDRQGCFYDQGVGTGVLKLTGGAFGWGIRRNLRQSYSWLVENYFPGDKIFLIGWSRGAYTARSLGGLINHSGLVYDTKYADDAWKAYRERTELKIPRLKVHVQACVAMDTVGALGIPYTWWKTLSPVDHRFHDTNAPAILNAGLHQIAINEHRKPFDFTPWDGDAVQTVHYIGDHGNVGGGKLGGLRDITFSDALQWLESRGMNFLPGWQEHVQPDPDAKIGKSGGLWGILGKIDRNFGLDPVGHDTVFKRDNFPESDWFQKNAL